MSDSESELLEFLLGRPAPEPESEEAFLNFLLAPAARAPRRAVVLGDGAGGLQMRERFKATKQREGWVEHLGYVSLFPLMLRLLPADAPQLPPLLELLREPSRISSCSLPWSCLYALCCTCPRTCTSCLSRGRGRSRSFSLPTVGTACPETVLLFLEMYPGRPTRQTVAARCLLAPASVKAGALCLWPRGKN